MVFNSDYFQMEYVSKNRRNSLRQDKVREMNQRSVIVNRAFGVSYITFHT